MSSDSKQQLSGNPFNSVELLVAEILKALAIVFITIGCPSVSLLTRN